MLLSLVMLVRDEADSIVRTIESVLPWIDRYTILDTGSSDGTQALARAALGSLPGELVEEPFLDFARSRNRALDIAGEHTAFTLMLSGDETLINGRALRSFCVDYFDSPIARGAFDVEIRFGDLVFVQPRLQRSDGGWRYEGPVHEALVGPTSLAPGPKVPGVHVLHDTATRDERRARRRILTRDLPLLEREDHERPTARTAFYLAQTRAAVFDFPGALEAYDRCIALGGWPEQTFEATRRTALLLEIMGRGMEAETRMLAAHDLRPHRAEPLRALARMTSVPARARAYLALADRLPFPTGERLFVDTTAYKTAPDGARSQP